MLTEKDMDIRIQKYWDKLEKKWPEIAELKNDLNNMCEQISTKFWEPSNEKPMEIAHFLKFLDVKPLIDVAKKFYRRLQNIEYLESFVKTVIFMILKKSNPHKTGQSLKVSDKDAEYLGFKKLPNGKRKVISGKTIWYNLRKRFKLDGIKEMIKKLRVCVREAAEKLGIKIGENLATDPFPVEAVSTDENAEYSGYHRIEGYKCVLTIDIETNIPLVGEVIGINENDGEKLIPHIRDVKSSGMKPKNHWVDGNFTSTEIIAKAEMCENVHLHYRIEKDWVYHPEASNEKLKREYQKYHKEPDFLVGAHHDFMMRYLVEKGNYDVVGNILRNERMAEYEEAPDSYLDDYHQRNRSESINNHLANNLQTRLRVNRKGKETVESSLCLSILTLLAVAFVKLLNGIKTNLVSLDGVV